MTLVATALCADRAVATSPPDRTAGTSENRSLVGRLSSGLRRTVTPVRFVAQRRFGPVIVSSGDVLVRPIVPVLPAMPVAPQQLPQPPPSA